VVKAKGNWGKARQGWRVGFTGDFRSIAIGWDIGKILTPSLCQGREGSKILTGFRPDCSITPIQQSLGTIANAGIAADRS